MKNFDRIPVAVRDLKKVIEISPLHESAYRNLMILYADSGETNTALKVFDECSRIIQQDLGAEPDPRTVRLYHEICSRHGCDPSTGSLFPGADPAPPRGEAGSVMMIKEVCGFCYASRKKQFPIIFLSFMRL